MLIDHLNLNQVRIFECVFRTRSMTIAARELHLTQSGISQHMKSLEEMLDQRLFDRIGQRLIPTPQAKQLYESCSQGLLRIERGFLEIKSEEKNLRGSVSLGMPSEFGNNVIIPLLAQFCRKHPLVKLKVKFDFASAMSDPLLSGDLDFAFIDDFRMDRRIHTEKVFDEILDLCMSRELFKTKGKPRNHPRYFESLEYVDYQENEAILRMWFDHHLKSRSIPLNVRTTVMDVQAVARLILSNVGAGILPGHLSEKLRSEGHRIYKFKGCGVPLKNMIRVAYLEGRSHSPATLGLLSYLKSAL